MDTGTLKLSFGCKFETSLCPSVALPDPHCLCIHKFVHTKL